MGKNWEKNQTLLTCTFCKNWNSPKIFEHFVSLLKHYLWCKFHQDLIIFERVRAQKNPKMAQLMDAPSHRRLLKIYNLKTTNAMKMKLIAIVYLHKTFHLTKDLGVTHRTWEGVTEKLLKKSQKISFLAPFFQIFRSISETITYVILCLALHHWWKCSTNQTSFGVLV